MKYEPSNKDKSLLKLAATVSTHSTHHRAKIGAVIVKNGNVVSMGFNKDSKTHPIIYSVRSKKTHHIRSIHAEMSALIAARTDLTGATIYLYREKIDDVTHEVVKGMSKPCEVCQELLRKAGVKKAVYTTDTDEYGVIYL